MSSEPDGDDEVASLEHELTVLLRRARAYSGELARAVHPDLEAAAYGLLMHVVDGGARAADLAEYFGIDKSTVSRQVRLLEQLGLLRREADPQDLRVLRLVVTEEGLRRLRAARDARRQRVEERLEGWAPDDVGRLAGLLARYNAAAG
ncbi:MAG TPA: MarR family transcriptional regulator [Mycobacteriales bacterium]|nr:MarR family transcriptional regulator [Mycobacteriales bacterium]